MEILLVADLARLVLLTRSYSCRDINFMMERFFEYLAILGENSATRRPFGFHAYRNSPVFGLMFRSRTFATQKITANTREPQNIRDGEG